MQRANLMEQKANDRTIAAVACVMDLPLDLGRPRPTASHGGYFAVFVDWLRATWHRAAMRSRDFGVPGRRGGSEGAGLDEPSEFLR
jgi:hypothetical protein